MSDAESSPVAALDVGSNTIRLLVARASGGDIRSIDDQSEFVRLGKGVDASGRLQPDRMDAAMRAVHALTEKARSEGAVRVVGVATSAVRDAKNGEEFAARVERETGVELRILSGEEEARLTAVGAMAGLDVDGPAIVVDLGGGSAEIVYAESSRLAWARTLQLGSGRLTEWFIESDPPDGEQIERLVARVRDEIAELPRVEARSAVITGGTATHVALIAGLSGTTIRTSPDVLRDVQTLVSSVPAADIVKRYGVRPERAEVLPAGVSALAAVVAYYRVTTVVITTKGIREGAIIDFLQRDGQWPNQVK